MKPTDILKNYRGIALAVLTMLIAILASMTGAALVFSRVDLMISSNYRKGTQALYAADAGVGHALNQISGNVTTAVTQFGPVDLGGGFFYRSGRRSDSGAQPFLHTGSSAAAGYSMGSGTGYNPAGYVLITYEIHVTGTGSLSAAREIEALGAYGPVPN